MSTPAVPSWLVYKQVGAALVVKLPSGNLFHDEVIDLIEEHVLHLIDKSGSKHLVLDFGLVERIASEMLSFLLVTQKRLRSRDGWLILCALKPDLREVFASLRLDQVFRLVDGEEQALRDPPGSAHGANREATANLPESGC